MGPVHLATFVRCTAHPYRCTVKLYKNITVLGGSQLCLRAELPVKFTGFLWISARGFGRQRFAQLHFPRHEGVELIRRRVGFDAALQFGQFNFQADAAEGGEAA